MRTRIRPLIGALIRMIRPGMGIKPGSLIGSIVSHDSGEAGGDRIATESVFFELLTRLDVFVI